MKNISIVLTAAVLFLSSAAPAFAAMPNFIGTGYKQAAQCVVPPDTAIFEAVGSQMVMTGCISADAEAASIAEALRVQDKGIKFAVATSVTLKDNTQSMCPWYFINAAGCVIAPELVK